jgi:hypothetical protein
MKIQLVARRSSAETGVKWMEMNNNVSVLLPIDQDTTLYIAVQLPKDMYKTGSHYIVQGNCLKRVVYMQTGAHKQNGSNPASFRGFFLPSLFVYSVPPFVFSLDKFCPGLNLLGLTHTASVNPGKKGGKK